MTLREKAGQLVMFAVSGTRLTADERAAIERHHLGGFILFSRNYRDREQLARLTRQIQKATRAGNDHRIGALISVDQEGGVVKRFEDMPPRYSAPEMGRIGKESVALGQGRATGRALKNAGVNVDLAPVADLDIGPNHTMRDRSFGSREYRVGKLVRGFASGLQDRHVAAAVKHFPGFGGADINSDFGKAQVRRTRRQLHRVDAVPFHHAIGAGVKMVMVSHGIYVKDGGRRPASLNRYIATERLRDEFGFGGVAISDDLVALDWKTRRGIDSLCRKTIEAGVDIALITGGIDMARRCAGNIRKAVTSGALSDRRVDEAVARVLELKAWLGVFDPRA